MFSKGKQNKLLEINKTYFTIGILTFSSVGSSLDIIDLERSVKGAVDKGMQIIIARDSLTPLGIDVNCQFTL